jgi:hypothetical protein
LKKQTPFSTHPHFLPSSLTTIPSSKPKYKQNKHAPPSFSHLFIFTPSFSLNSSLWYHKRGVFVGRNSTRSKIWSCFCQQQLMRSNNVSFFTADLFYAKWVFLDSSYVKDGVLNQRFCTFSSSSFSYVVLLFDLLWWLCYCCCLLVVILATRLNLLA